MAKTVAIVTFMELAAEFYSGQLKELFGDLIETKLFSVEKHTTNQGITGDIIIVSTYSIYKAIKNNLSVESEVVIPNLTLSKSALSKIKSIPRGTKCMLINSSIDMCIDTISLIGQLGVNHVEFVPVYPGISKIPNLKLAVTPGESRFAPENISKLIDIGDRIFDVSTIIEIVLKLNLEFLLKDEKFIRYSERIATNTYSLEKLAGKTNKLESQFDILLRTLDEGIIGINADGVVFAINRSAERIIKKEKDEVIGRTAKELFNYIPFEEVMDSMKPVRCKLIKINDIYIDLSIEPVVSGNMFIGIFIIMKKFKDTEYQQQKLRLQLLNRGYRAKYSFEDIIGESAVIVKTKKIAKKMAATNSPILITGESGTGKELFAQALHNSSLRKDSPFVAVNCAAIPENLLESELFGYEEGAFTGAKKGGRPGLFEFAHMGTLFLDEIEAMSLNLQSKLLRILQEKEVIRLGGDRVISVDVRVIATTNEDLTELISKGKFRKDLYFRLNVLPLNIPPLRDRGNDILLILEKIKKDLNSEFELSDELEKIFLNYSWEGNIRELKNYIEYLTCIAEDKITIDDLPLSLLDSINNINITPTYDYTKVKDIVDYKDFIDAVNDKLNDYITIMDQLFLCYQKRIGIGRKSLSKIMEGKNLFLTESEIRTIFSNLQKYKMITISRGRSGSKLTELGISFMNNVKRVK